MCVWIYYTCRMTRINSSLIFLLLLLCGLTSFAQNQLLSGKIIDADSKSPLIGVSVLNEQNQGVSSDIDGNYELSLSKGEHTITFSFIGYETKKIQVNMDDGPQSLDVKLYTQTLDIDIVVISAGKFEQDLSEVTVSMDVLKPALIENKSTTNMEDLLQQSPGVSIVDGEPQIRSGSGYSFGAGSRVMILVDDLPILSGDAGRPSWGFLPVENVEQIEVIKGASSVLYGSAALSGVINIRTAYPKDKPLTKINTYAGVYSDPETSEGKYWNGNGILSGMNFLHSRRIGTLDLVIGGNVLGDDSYLGPIVDENGQQSTANYNPFDVNRYDADSRARLSLSLRKRSISNSGLNYGINTSWLKGESLAALLWDNDSTGLYAAYAGSATRTKQLIGSVDPFIEYHNGRGTKHTLRTRWQSLDNDNDNNQGNFSDVYYGEYQFQHLFDSSDVKDFTITSGLTSTLTESRSQLFAGSDAAPNTLNKARNVAVYLQLDKKFFGKLNTSVGMRYEYFDVNGEASRQPVFRSGINYQIARGTFARASFGQGFRFPTIAEKFINTAVGDLTIYPNEELEAEKSWNAEVGIKQGFKVKGFKGYIDVAAFWQEYENFIEFTFGKWGGPQNNLGGIGFRSLNTGNSKVVGAEITLMGTGDIGNTTIN
ncbi:MAG: TonB-dependent receptor, partial [Flavobacteriales bacterium]